jgi:hypothetical protein
MYNSQQSQETNSNTGKIIESNKSIERQTSQPASSSYTASQTHDEVRYDGKITLKKSFICFIDRLKSRDLIAGAFSMAELPEGSSDPVELAARVEDGRIFILNKLILLFLFSYQLFLKN